MSEKKQFTAVQFPVSETIGHYVESKGLDDASIKEAKFVYNNNEYVNVVWIWRENQLLISNCK